MKPNLSCFTFCFPSGTMSGRGRRRAPEVQDLVDSLGHLDINTPPPHRSPLTAERLMQHNKALFELRMFGCGTCQILFYQKVEKTKPVSVCSTCRECLQAIPVHEEPAGLGFFKCFQCSHHWTAYPAARDVKQPCYRCQRSVKPRKVIPSPSLRADPDQRPRSTTGNRHSCYACRDLGPGQNCPLRGRFGFVASVSHDCSGSTISLGITSKYKKILSPENVARHQHLMRNHDHESASDDSDESTSSVSTAHSTAGNGGNGGGRGRGRGNGRGRGRGSY